MLLLKILFSVNRKKIFPKFKHHPLKEIEIIKEKVLKDFFLKKQNKRFPFIIARDISHFFHVSLIRYL